MIGQMNPSPFQGKTMSQIIASRLAPLNSAGLNYTVTASLSAAESARNHAIQANLSTKNFAGNTFTRVQLPGDDKHSQALRDQEARRQCVEPWGNTFMHTPTDAQRLNNPAQKAFVERRQLAPPSTYGQFYAFMHALSAAFGTLQQVPS